MTRKCRFWRKKRIKEKRKYGNKKRKGNEVREGEGNRDKYWFGKCICYEKGMGYRIMKVPYKNLFKLKIGVKTSALLRSAINSLMEWSCFDKVGGGFIGG